jgi:hypothetical protein
MTIVATAPVSGGTYLAGLDTAEFPAIVGDVFAALAEITPGQAQRVLDLDARARHMLDSGLPLADVATQLGVSAQEALDLFLDDLARQHGWHSAVGVRPDAGDVEDLDVPAGDGELRAVVVPATGEVEIRIDGAPHLALDLAEAAQLYAQLGAILTDQRSGLDAATGDDDGEAAR